MFQDKLKKLRMQANLTQAELAKHIFVSRSAVAKWEQGRGLPTVDSLEAELNNGEEDDFSLEEFAEAESIPLVLEDEGDYDLLAEGDEIYIEGLASAIKGAQRMSVVNRKNNARVWVKLDFTPRQREILLAGGMLNYTKNRGEEI